MALRNTQTHYGRLSIGLHWLMALLIIGMIVAGFSFDFMEDSDFKFQLMGLHKATGVLILALALFRWYWTLSSEKVTPLASYSDMTRRLAHGNKWLLMLLMLGMPISGLGMSICAARAVNVYGLFTIPALAEKNREWLGFFHEAHEILGYSIAVLVGLHLLFAIKHHWFDKDETLLRMLGRN